MKRCAGNGKANAQFHALGNCMGSIVTFYSYKGGVGRKMALANIGVLLARDFARKVLMVDFDLEAPGLHAYFRDMAAHSQTTDIGTAFALAEIGRSEQASWKDHVQQIVVPGVAKPLSMMPSGSTSRGYSALLQSLSWDRLFAERAAGRVLEQWRNEWLNEYDFVLIDSRTGITDTGGVCTMLLPDTVVLVVTANNQSLEGGRDAMRSAQAARAHLDVERDRLRVIPLIGRFDGRVEVDDSRRWLDRIARDLGEFFEDWRPINVSPHQILELTKIPYVSKHSFGEPLPVLTHGTIDPDSPGYAMAKTALLLNSGFAAVSVLLESAYKPQLAALKEVAMRQVETGVGPAIAEAKRLIDGGCPGDIVCGALSDTASEMMSRGAVNEAEAVLRAVLVFAEAAPTRFTLFAGTVMTQLSHLLQRTNRLDEAEQYMRQALRHSEQNGGNDDLSVADCLDNLASLLQVTGRLEEAVPLMRRAIEITERALGDRHPNAAVRLSNLAQVYQAANRLLEAESLMRRTLSIYEESFGENHANVARALNNLAGLLQATNRLAEAEPLMRRALMIDEASLGKDTPNVATALNNLASLLQATNRLTEAEPLMRRALAIEEASYGKDHPSVARDLNNLAQSLKATNRLAEAEPLMRRALAIDEASYGTNHPNVARDLNNLALLLLDTNRLAEAEPLIRRALAIDEASYSKDHPDVARDLNNLASLLQDTNRLGEAEPLMRRTLEIFLKFTARTRHQHPHLMTAANNFIGLLIESGVPQAEAVRRVVDLFKTYGISISAE